MLAFVGHVVVEERMADELPEQPEAGQD